MVSRRTTSWLVLLALVASLLIGIQGALNHHLLIDLPWRSTSDLLVLGTILIFGFLFSFLASSILRLNSLASGFIITSLFSIVSGQFCALIASVLLLSTAYILGKRILLAWCVSLDVGLSGVNDYIWAVLMGFGVFGLVLTGLAHFSVNTPLIYQLLCCSILLADYKLVISTVRSAWQSSLLNAQVNNLSSQNLIACLLVGVWLLHWSVSHLPEIGFDALTLHLRVPTEIAQTGRWSFNVEQFSLGVLPMFADWLYSIAFLMGSEISARQINCYFTGLMVSQVYLVSLWLGAPRTWSLLAALMTLTLPVAFTETNSLHVEGVWGAYLIAGMLCVFKLAFSKSSLPQDSSMKLGNSQSYYSTDCLIVMAGIFFGLALNGKHVTLMIIPACVALLAFRLSDWFSLVRKSSLIGGIITLSLIGSIPFAIAFALTGNPVFPFFNEIFNSPLYPSTNFNNPLFNSGSSLTLPYEMLFRSDKYLEATNGASGFQWLILMPAAIVGIINSHNARALSILGVIAISWFLIFQSQSYLRYVYPLMGILCAVIAYALYNVGQFQPMVNTAVGLVILLNLLYLSSANWAYRELPWRVWFDEEEKQRFLEGNAPEKLAALEINRTNLNRKPVAFFTNYSSGAYVDAQVLYPHGYNTKFKSALENIQTEADLLSFIQDWKIEFVIFRTGFFKQNSLNESMTKHCNMVKDFSTVQILRCPTPNTRH